MKERTWIRQAGLQFRLGLAWRILVLDNNFDNCSRFGKLDRGFDNWTSLKIRVFARRNVGLVNFD